MSEILNCRNCATILNDENKVKNKRLCRPCNSQLCKEYKQRNKDLISKYNKDYKSENKDIISKYNQDYHQKNKESIQKRHNKNDVERRKVDPAFKLAHQCRTRMNKLIKGKTIKSFKLLDCSSTFLKEWLEYNFKPGMTFDNHGSLWHIDHVIPCSIFDLNNDDEIKHCFRWTNLQPLEANLNIKKNNKLDKEEVINHYKKVKDFANHKKIQINEFDLKKYF